VGRIRVMSSQGTWVVWNLILGHVVEEVVRVPHGRAQPPRAVPTLAMDPGMWLNMVNVTSPYLVDFEIKSMKTFISEYKSNSQKCPRRLLRSMLQFVLQEHLDIIYSEAGYRS